MIPNLRKATQTVEQTENQNHHTTAVVVTEQRTLPCQRANSAANRLPLAADAPTKRAGPTSDRIRSGTLRFAHSQRQLTLRTGQDKRVPLAGLCVTSRFLSQLCWIDIGLDRQESIMPPCRQSSARRSLAVCELAHTSSIHRIQPEMAYRSRWLSRSLNGLLVGETHCRSQT